MPVSHIIIGGGIAGLLTAWALEKKNLPYILLEAKPELGGRIMGVKDTESNHYHDLGPTWIFPHQNNILSLLDELNISYYEQYTKGDVLYQPPGAQDIIRSSGSEAMNLFRVQGGMITIINALVDKLNDVNSNRVKINYTVKSVSLSKKIWKVVAENNNEKFTFESQKLMLALPPRMIIKYLTPENWASSKLINDLQQVPTWMAAQAKFVASYDTPFWRENGLSGQVYSQKGPMQEMHDAGGAEGFTNALFGFIGVPAQHRIEYDEAQIKRACLDQLIDLYGAKAGNTKTTLLKDWAIDGYVATESDINEAPRHPEFPMSIHQKELEAKQVYLVGSEFSNTDAGYLEGAVCAVNERLSSII